jgi:hypothetical protein
LIAAIVPAVLSFPRPEFRGTLVETEIQRCQVERPKLGVVLDVTVLRIKSIYKSELTGS